MILWEHEAFYAIICPNKVSHSRSLRVLLLLPLSVHSTNVYNVHFQPDAAVSTKDTKMSKTPLQLSLSPCQCLCVCVCVCVCVYIYIYIYIYINFFFPLHEACGILVPQPGIKPTPPAVEARSSES